MDNKLTRRSLITGFGSLAVISSARCMEVGLPLITSLAVERAEDYLTQDISAEEKPRGGMRYTQKPRFVDARANVSGTLYSALDDCLYIVEGSRGENIRWSLDKISGKDKTRVSIDKFDGTTWIGGGQSIGNESHKGKSRALPWRGKYAVIVSYSRDSREELAEPIEFSLYLEKSGK